MGPVLGRVLACLDTSTLSSKIHLVSKAWQHAVFQCLVQRPDAVRLVDGEEEGGLSAGHCGAAAPLQTLSVEALRRKFPWARFLAEGGFKQVYIVWNEQQDRTEALSVMDMVAMSESGNEAVADSEVRLSFLLSQLVERGACNHFVRVYQLLRCATPPPSDWGNATNKQPQGSLSCFRKGWAAGQAPACAHAGRGSASSRPGGRPARLQPRAASDYQYIRMELCDGGDLEQALREHARPRPRVVGGLLRQMALALLFAQQELRMRHYDVKLLNFFLKSEPRGSADAVSRERAPDALAGDEFWEPCGREWVVKVSRGVAGTKAEWSKGP